MQSEVLKDYYRPLLEQNHFIPIPCPDKFSPAGQCWEISPSVGGGRGGLQNVVSYIADHYAFDIPLERLASIACMSETKLKGCFKRQFGCSITQYIQGRRMSQAEHLLINTDFTMGQIAQMIGYTTSSRFAELFKKSTGILPIEYRKIARKE